jgi:hypothetical protein
MPLTLVVGQKERFYLAVRHRGVYRKAVPPGMSVKITSRNAGVAVIHEDPQPIQDPSEGAPPTVASAMIEAIKTCSADTTITALLKLASGQADAIAQDTVKVLKCGERAGTLFGSSTFIEAANPTPEPEGGESEAATSPEQPIEGSEDPYKGLTAKQRRIRRRRGNHIDIVTEAVSTTEAQPVEAVQEKEPEGSTE